MVLIWRTRRTYPGFGCWTTGNVAYAAGSLLIVLRGTIPDGLSIILANLLILCAAELFLVGTRRFRGAPGVKAFDIILMVLLVIVQGYFTYLHNDLGIRVIAFSLILALVFGLGAWELLGNAPPDQRFSLRFTGSLFASASLLLLVRVIATILGPGPHDIFTPNFIQTVTFLLCLLMSIAWTFGFVMLNSERLEVDLKKAQVELQRLATTDYLTGIANNRSFFETGERELQRTRRYGHPLAVLMLDLDRFKRVNDTYGHAVGDRVLVSVAATCRYILRDIDIFGRLGGEEFGILLPETDLAGGKATAERLRLAVADAAIDVDASKLRTTISIGVSALAPDDDRIEATLKRADDAMYEAKRKGRNRVVTAPSPSSIRSPLAESPGEHNGTQ